MATKEIDYDRLRAVAEIVERIGSGSSATMPFRLICLKHTLMTLWETVKNASGPHQDVLAIFESGVIQAADAESVTDGQLDCFRLAIELLSTRMFAPEELRLARKRFIRAGFGPLAFIDE
jgi:hypothetical protein